jgi:Pyruvate/2-oxoacid:ferredoxin oxidoreductase delta subunit
MFVLLKTMWKDLPITAKRALLEPTKDKERYRLEEKCQCGVIILSHLTNDQLAVSLDSSDRLCNDCGTKKMEAKLKDEAYESFVSHKLRFGQERQKALKAIFSAYADNHVCRPSGEWEWLLRALSTITKEHIAAAVSTLSSDQYSNTMYSKAILNYIRDKSKQRCAKCFLMSADCLFYSGERGTEHQHLDSVYAVCGICFRECGGAKKRKAVRTRKAYKKPHDVEITCD